MRSFGGMLPPCEGAPLKAVSSESLALGKRAGVSGANPSMANEGEGVGGAFSSVCVCVGRMGVCVVCVEMCRDV